MTRFIKACFDKVLLKDKRMLVKVARVVNLKLVFEDYFL